LLMDMGGFVRSSLHPLWERRRAADAA